MRPKKTNSVPLAPVGEEPDAGLYTWRWHARLAAVIYGLLLIGYMILAKWLK